MDLGFEPFDPRSFDDPYPAYARLRAQAPLYRGPRHRFWTLSRFDDIKSALADHESFSSDARRGGIGITPAEAGETSPPSGSHEFPVGNLILMDPPRHTAFRKVVAKRFLQKSMAPLEILVRQVVDELLDEFCEAGQVDLMERFTCAVPARVFADVLGVPRSQARDLQRWAAVLTTVPTTMEASERHREAVANVRALFEALRLEKQARPADDLLTDMALETGPGKTYREDEFVGMAVSMMIAGNDTTANALASLIHLLARHPDQRRKLVADPSRTAAAVEEGLRFEPPVHGLARVLTRDVELHGRRLSAGDKVLLLYASGNRDERVFEEPERFDIDRKLELHLSFGFGIHHCVGIRLGRLEMQIALRAFLDRIPEYELASDAVHWTHVFATRQMAALPIAFAPSRPVGARRSLGSGC